MAAPNPYTQALLAAGGPPGTDAAAFVAHWDAVESLVLGVYRAGRAGPEQEAEWRTLCGWFGAHYPELAGRLAAHRPGGAAAADPFQELLARPTAAAFAGDAGALRRLPAAREALNRWLLAAG